MSSARSGTRRATAAAPSSRRSSRPGTISAVVTRSRRPYTRLPASVRSRIGVRISSRNTCAPLNSTPAAASSIAGSTSDPHGSRPCKRCACSSPATSPGTATDASPTWNTCVEASAKSTTTSSISPAAREGTEKKQSSIVGSSPASRTSRKPPPAGPLSGPSATKPANAAATTASTALPPLASARAPASAVCGLPAAMAPLMSRA